MPSVYDSISVWARWTSSSLADLLSTGSRGQAPEPGEVAYRLRQWPELPQEQKTAAVLCTLSVMSNRPVNRRWMLAGSRLSPAELDCLLQRLADQGALETIDTSRFADAPPGR